MPTKAISELLLLSKRLCKTFKGLFFEISAKPISSKTTNGIIDFLGLLSCLYPSNIFFAFSKTLKIPSEVDVSEPLF